MEGVVLGFATIAAVIAVGALVAHLGVVDLAAHGRADLAERLAHRWPGFSDAAMREQLRDAGLRPADPITVPGPLEVRLWPALLPLPVHAPHFATEDA